MVELLLSFCRQGNWDPERLSNLADVTHLVSGGFDLDIGGLKPEPPLNHQSVLLLETERVCCLEQGSPSNHSSALGLWVTGRAAVSLENNERPTSFRLFALFC